MTRRQRAKDISFLVYLFTCMAWYLTAAGLLWNMKDLPIWLAALKFGSGLILSAGLMLFALNVRSRWWLVAVCLLLGAESFEAWWFYKLHAEMRELKWHSFPIGAFTSLKVKPLLLAPGILMNLLVCWKPAEKLAEPENNSLPSSEITEA